MDDLNKLKKFVFNGILLEDTFLNLEKSGIPIKSGEKINPISRINEKEFNPIIIHDANKMASVYVVFFCLENSVRYLIQERLSERKGISWWNDCVPVKIKQEVEKLKEKEDINRYHAQRATTLVGYTTFGNLSQIIISNWEDFSDIFPDQHWIKSRFHDLEMSRNIIMHTGILPEFEIERIESIARDWVRQLG